MSKYPFIQQHDEKDCGAACLSMISEYYGLKLPIAKFRELIKVDNQGANIYGLVTGAQKLGFDADALEGNLEELLEGIENTEIQFPFVARIVNEQMFEHYIVVYEIIRGFVMIGDPGKSRTTKIPLAQFADQWQGQLVTFLPNANFKEKNERKGSFKKYFRYIASQKKLLAFVFVISLVVSLINISGAVIFEYILSDSLKLTDTVSGMVFANIHVVCFVIILMYLLRGILNNLRGYLLALTAKKVDDSMTLDYYNHLVDLPVAFYETRKTGEFMSRFYDASKIRDAISTATLTVMLDTIMAIGCGVLLCYINVTLFLITLVVMVLYALVIFLFKNPIKAINHELMEQDAQVTSFLKESIDGMETVKAYQHENAIKRKIEDLYKHFTHRNVQGTLIYNFQDSIISFVASTGLVVLLWIGAYLCADNVIDIADLFVFYYLINYFLDPLSNLINLQPELQTAIVAAERLNDVLDADIEEENSKRIELQHLRGNIKIENLDFRYGNRELVLRDVNMEFEKSKKIAIVGESGCGKTTLAKLLLSFYQPECGNVLIGGKSLSEYTICSIRKHIAYVSQDIFLFSDTIYNNLRLGNEEVTDEEIRSICEQCGISSFIESLPLGYNTMLEENGNNLSGGQKQRLAVVRALLRKPDVLIMDEATSNLDTITEKSIKQMLEQFSETMTCIIIAHRMNTIKNCDYIYVMDKGSVIEQGTHQSLLDEHGVYRKLVDSYCSDENY